LLFRFLSFVHKNNHNPLSAPLLSVVSLESKLRQITLLPFTLQVDEEEVEEQRQPDASFQQFTEQLIEENINTFEHDPCSLLSEGQIEMGCTSSWTTKGS
jgi:hypothetical protein